MILLLIDFFQETEKSIFTESTLLEKIDEMLINCSAESILIKCGSIDFIEFVDISPSQLTVIYE